ncbi:MAG: hypothetical protein AAF125_23565 [Chloroflexota bacterium]
MIPPTPTPYVVPPDASSADFTMPDISLWDSAPTAVGIWNEIGPATTVFQALIIIAIATALIFLFANMINRETTIDE